MVYIETMFTTMGPAFCVTVSKKRKRSKGTELLRVTEVYRCTTVIQIAFIPVLKVKFLKRMQKIIVISLVMGFDKFPSTNTLGAEK